MSFLEQRHLTIFHPQILIHQILNSQIPLHHLNFFFFKKNNKYFKNII